jgi:branched-chain amino acid transport system ATP-binding protein
MNMTATAAGNATPGRNGEVLLEIEGLHVAYGKAEVVHGVSINVHAGEFVVLLGRNGAGKSTILHALSGLIPKLAGRVRFAGADITDASPREIVRAGVIQVLEGHRVFTTLSVEDNLLIGTYANTPRGDRSKLEGIYALFPELADHRQQLASRLSGGQQQILAVAQGVIANPRLLVLDEPSGGLAPIVIDRVLDVATRLCAGGVAILLVEQLVEKALHHAHWSYLIETGRVAAAASSIEIQRSEMLHKAYLGGAIAVHT